MKPALLLFLLCYAAKPVGPPPPSVRVTLTPLRKAAYLAARKTRISTRPTVTYPLAKQGGCLVIPTAAGNRIFRDQGIGTDDVEQAQFEYLGYTPRFRQHSVLAHHWERTHWLLLAKNGHQLTFYNAPDYSPDLTSFVVVSAGIEFGVYPNSIQLFHFEKGSWQPVGKLAPKTWEPQAVFWTANNFLVLSQRKWTGSHPGTTYTYAKATIEQ